MFEFIRSNVQPGPYEKVYLTRTQFKSKNPCIGEEYFESFYRNRGYEVIAPETLSLEEQVSVISGASHIVGSSGTVTHLAVFAKDAVELTILNRSEVTVSASVVLARVCNAHLNWIDAHINFLPEHYGLGVFLMGPNRCWKRYLDDHPELTDQGDDEEYDLAERSLQYVKAWGAHLTDLKTYDKVHNAGLPNVIRRINTYLLDNPNVKMGSFPPMDKQKALQKQVDALQARVKELEEAVEQLSNLKIEEEQIIAREISASGSIKNASQPDETAHKRAFFKFKKHHK